MSEPNTIRAFVTHRSPGLDISRYPDEENRDSKDIDAIAGRFAIEHTSIDALENQRRDSAWFSKVVGNLEGEISPQLTFRLRVRFDNDAVASGQDWAAIQSALKTWILGDAREVTEAQRVDVEIPGVPFPASVLRSSNEPPGLVFSRLAPAESGLSDRVRATIERKAEKLAKYHGPGRTTILLVESEDVALMSYGSFLQSVGEAFPEGLPASVDELWFADTYPAGPPQFHEVTADL